MSTIKTINFNTNDQNKFIHDTSKVSITTFASLIKVPLETSELSKFTVKATKDADVSTGSGLATLVGSAALVTDSGEQYYDLTNGVGNYVQLSDSLDYDTGLSGTYRMKFKPNYTGNPPSSSVFFSTGESRANSNSLVELMHLTDGNIRAEIRNEAGTGGSYVLGPWSPTAGVEYEIEFYHDMATTTTAVFVDGVLIGSFASTPSTTGARSYFILGEDRTAAVACHGLVRDLQIFTEVQHITNFTGEVPRTLVVYPVESFIEPTDSSMSEGLFSIADSVVLSGDSAVKYVLKIENQYYYINGGTLVVSNKTYAQSTSDTDWNLPASVALVDAAIVNGARITFCPVLSSGAKTIYSPELASTTTTYDFYALPISCNDCTLYGFIKDNCENVVSGTVRVYVKKPFLAQGNLVSFDETVNVRFDAVDPANDGYFELPLIIPDQGDQYFYEAKWIDSDGKNWKYKAKILIPNATSALLETTVQ